MDFTPLSLDTVPRIQRRTTAGFELALSVLFLSGIQHFVEIPSGMKNAPPFVKSYLQSLPTQWEDTRFISGYPGKDVVVARKSGANWYIAGINGENKPKELTLDLSFLNGKNISLLSDSDENVPVPLKIESIKNSIYKVSMKANGGFVIVEN
jgi:hypothetical protein